jgi:hypothetical protein
LRAFSVSGDSQKYEREIFRGTWTTVRASREELLRRGYLLANVASFDPGVELGPLASFLCPSRSRAMRDSPAATELQLQALAHAFMSRVGLI